MLHSQFDRCKLISYGGVLLILIAFVTLIYVSSNSFLDDEKDDEYLEVCDLELPNSDIINKVYSQLDYNQREEILNPCTDTVIDRIPVTESLLSHAMSNGKLRNYLGENVYEIKFASRQEASLGDLFVFVDVESLEIICLPLRD